MMMGKLRIVCVVIAALAPLLKLMELYLGKSANLIVLDLGHFCLPVRSSRSTFQVRRNEYPSRNPGGGANGSPEREGPGRQK